MLLGFLHERLGAGGEHRQAADVEERHEEAHGVDPEDEGERMAVAEEPVRRREGGDGGEGACAERDGAV